MKKRFLLLSAIILLSNNSTKSDEFEVLFDESLLEPKEIKIVNGIDRFLYDIGHRESRNRYEIVNRFGYMGKYQFGISTLRGLGYDISKHEFLNNPEIQEKAMIDLLKHNKYTLRHYINRYDGTIFNGYYVTESGILAAAHLAGAGNVRNYFNKGKDFEDGLGTRLTTYLHTFSGYELNLDKEHEHS